MSYAICIWDPARHPPMPATEKEAAATMERLSELSDPWNSTLAEFGSLLVQRYEAEPAEKRPAGGMKAFYGSDPRKTAAECKSAVYRMSLPDDDSTRQISYAVKAAASLGLIVYDDEIGICFLPDGKILPEDSREMWEFSLAEMNAVPDPNEKKGDGRPFWARILSDLFDAMTSGRR